MIAKGHSTHRRHTPRRRIIQYAASSRFRRWRRGILDARLRGHDGLIRLRILATHCARGLQIHSAPKRRGRSATLKRGRREDRVRAAPAVSCAKVTNKKRTRAYRFSGSSPAFPAQWFYGLSSCSPRRDQGLFVTVAARKRELPANLTHLPLGRQDHTTLPYASAALVSRSISVHRSPTRVS